MADILEFPTREKQAFSFLQEQLSQLLRSKGADQALIDTFLDALWLEKGLSENTLKSYRNDLEKLGGWVSDQHSSLLAPSRRII